MTSFHHEILNKRTLSGKWRAIPEEPLPLQTLLSNIRTSARSREEIINEDFCPIFFCYRHPSSSDLFCMDLMITAIRQDILEIKLDLIVVPPQLNEILDSDRGSRGRVYESGEHKGMKKWVEQYLDDLGFQIARGEISQLGYEVDVGCLEKKIFVECGDTEPRKIFEFLRNGVNIGLLQYNSEHIVWFITSDSFRAFAENKSFGYI